MEKAKVVFYKQFAEYLGHVLGPDYEIIIHSVDNAEGDNAHVVALVNGYISGRTLDSPLTDLALKMIREKDYVDHDYKTNYKTSAKNNHEIIGSTFFIKNDRNEIQGMLCINHDVSKVKHATDELLKTLNLTPSDERMRPQQISESLSGSIEEIIYSVVDPAFLSSDMMLSPQQKEKIIGKLYDKGVFTMKGAVSTVAKILGISEPTIYRYLKNFK